MNAFEKSPGKSMLLWALAALNIALLVMFVFHAALGQPAMAQQQMVPRPGDYLMCPGEVVGGSDAVVYVVSQSSRQLSAMVYDGSAHQLRAMPPINLDRIMNTPPEGAGTGGSRSRTMQQ